MQTKYYMGEYWTLKAQFGKISLEVSFDLGIGILSERTCASFVKIYRKVRKIFVGYRISHDQWIAFYYS